MNIETNISKFKGFANPLTKEGVRALAIVLGVLVVIAAAVYVANFGKRRESTVLPTEILREVTVTPQPIIPTKIPSITSLTEEEELPASPSPTRKVQIKEATVTPAPTI